MPKSKTVTCDITCNLCDWTKNLSLGQIAGEYLIHVVKDHWDTVVLLKAADDDLITAAKIISGQY